MLDLSLAINIGTRIGGFSPASLFAASEPGGWYDPSDLTTLFQDSTGLSPVTTPGQSVGLWLDKSQGLVLGSELLGNPSFDSAANYSLIAGATISGGQLFLDNQTNSRAEGTGNFLPTGKILQVEVDVAANSGSFAIVLADAGGALTIVGPTFTGTGIQRGLVFSGATNGNFRIIRTAGSATLNSISFKVLAGNHLTQSTLSNRAIYGIEPVGGRRNLLTYTEQFDNAVWTKANATITANATASPDGTVNADKIVGGAGGSAREVSRAVVKAASAITYTASAYVKSSDTNFVVLTVFDGGSVFNRQWFNLQNGNAGSTAVGGGGFTGVTAAITDAGNGWWRCSVSFTSNTATLIQTFFAPTTADTVLAPPAGVTVGAFIWGAQLELGSTATAYQSVTDQWNVTEAGVPSVSYLQFDGSDDWLVSPTITPGIDKAQVFAGVRQLADTTGSIAETSADSSTNNGAFSLFTLAGADDVQLLSRGTTAVNIRHDGATEPFTAVYAGTADIAADGLVLRSNGTQVNQSTSDQGTGNYLAYPLYVGRRGGTSLPYNGRIYSLIVRFGANLDAATITQTENWVAGKTGITI